MSFREYLITGLWVAWLAFWWISSWRAKPIQRRESRASRMLHLIPFAVAAMLLVSHPRRDEFLGVRILPAGEAAFWIGTAILVAGFAISIWARVHLAGNWSGTVTIKEDHELIMSGPYRYVRHPIYSGVLLAFVGTAVARGNCAGFLAVICVLVALFRKFRLEDRWLEERFGQQYTEYRRHVRALVPGLF